MYVAFETYFQFQFGGGGGREAEARVLSGAKEMGKKLQEAHEKTGDAGAIGVTPRRRGRGRTAEPGPRQPSVPRSDQEELGFPSSCHAKHFDANVCYSWLTSCSFPAHITLFTSFFFCE